MRQPFFFFIVFLVVTLARVGIARADTTLVYTPTEHKYLDLAEEMIREKDYKTAAKHLKLVIKINPFNQEAHRRLGAVYEKQQDTGKAVGHYQRFLRKFGPDAEVAFKLAYYLTQDKDPEQRKQAADYYRMGLGLKDDPRARLQLARLLAKDKNTLDAAIAEYRTLTAGDPENAPLQKEYCQLVEQDDRYRAEAIGAYRKLVEMLPKDYVLHLHLARLLGKEDKYYDEACQLYGVLVENRPTYPMLRREYALLLARDNRHFDQAKKQFEVLFTLEKVYNDQVGYADLLASNKTTRPAAREEYQKLLKQKPKDWRVRLKYAQLLATEPDDYRDAIGQYQRVLKRNRKCAAAHRGLADIYAWQGKSNLALHHKELAFKYEPKTTKLPALDTTLKQRRQPVVGTGLAVRKQSGGRWAFTLTRLTVDGNLAFTPALRIQAEAGTEFYQTRTEHLNGTAAGLSVLYQPSPAGLLSATVHIRSLMPAWHHNDWVLSYRNKRENTAFGLGIKRQLRDDSMTALTGGGTSVRDQGPASENLVFAEYLQRVGKFTVEVKPFGGAITMDTVDVNLLFGTDLGASYLVYSRGTTHFFVEYSLTVCHYAADYSGFTASAAEPMAGGYFSPDLFFNHCPRLVCRYRMGDQKEFGLTAGPCFQYIKDARDEGPYQAGSFMDLLYTQKLGRQFYCQVKAGQTQIVKAFRRYHFTGSVSYIF